MSNEFQGAQNRRKRALINPKHYKQAVSPRWPSEVDVLHEHKQKQLRQGLEAAWAQGCGLPVINKDASRILRTLGAEFCNRSACRCVRCHVDHM